MADYTKNNIFYKDIEINKAKDSSNILQKFRIEYIPPDNTMLSAPGYIELPNGFIVDGEFEGGYNNEDPIGSPDADSFELEVNMDALSGDFEPLKNWLIDEIYVDGSDVYYSSFKIILYHKHISTNITSVIGRFTQPLSTNVITYSNEFYKLNLVSTQKVMLSNTTFPDILDYIDDNPVVNELTSTQEVFEFWCQGSGSIWHIEKRFRNYTEGIDAHTGDPTWHWKTMELIGWRAMWDRIEDYLSNEINHFYHRDSIVSFEFNYVPFMDWKFYSKFTDVSRNTHKNHLINDDDLLVLLLFFENFDGTLWDFVDGIYENVATAIKIFHTDSKTKYIDIQNQTSDPIFDSAVKNSVEITLRSRYVGSIISHNTDTYNDDNKMQELTVAGATLNQDSYEANMIFDCLPHTVTKKELQEDGENKVYRNANNSGNQCKLGTFYYKDVGVHGGSGKILSVHSFIESVNGYTPTSDVQTFENWTKMVAKLDNYNLYFMNEQNNSGVNWVWNQEMYHKFTKIDQYTIEFEIPLELYSVLEPVGSVLEIDKDNIIKEDWLKPHIPNTGVIVSKKFELKKQKVTLKMIMGW